MNRFIRDNRGQALVEFALILPILMFFLLAIMEGGRLFACYLEIQNAAREGARTASIGKLDGESETSARLQFHVVEPGTPTIKFFPEFIDVTKPRNTGEQVAVSVYHDITIETPLISDIIGNKVPVKASVTMRVE